MKVKSGHDVNVHFHDLGSIGVVANSLAGDLGWVDEVFQDSLVDLLEGTRTRALLFLLGASVGLSHHTALSNEDDVSVGELLL